MIVLDASALLAWLFRENGATEVSKVIGNCCLSTVNLGACCGLDFVARIRQVRQMYNTRCWCISAICAYILWCADGVHGGFAAGRAIRNTLLAEVLGRFARDGHDPRMVLRRLNMHHIDLVPFSDAHAIMAAAMLPLTSPVGLSSGDRACLSLALTRGLPAMTADKAWTKVDVGVEIICIR